MEMEMRIHSSSQYRGNFTSSSMASISDFAPLDDLIQIIYQGFNKFVVISKVSDVAWTLNVALVGNEGRWWKGAWSNDDLFAFAGNNASETLVELHANRMAESLRKGELQITNWSSNKDAHIKVSGFKYSSAIKHFHICAKLSFCGSYKPPVHIDLIEMTPQEACTTATARFVDVRAGRLMSSYQS